MRISLQTYGGIAGGMRLPARSLDTAALGEDDAEKTARLVDAALRDHPHAPPSAARADAMSYTIAIEDGGKASAITENDMSMTPAFAALLEWLEALLSKHP